MNVKVSEIIKFNQPAQYKEITNHKYPKRLPKIINKFYDFMDKLTDKPAKFILKLRGKIKWI